MKVRVSIFFILFLAIFSTAFAEQIPLQDFFKNPVSGSYEISSDGKYLAYLKPTEGRMNIFIRSTNDTKSETQVTFSKDRDVSQFFWKEDQLFYLKDFGGDENFHLFSVNIQKKTEKDITPFPQTRVEIISDLKYGSVNEILISHNQRNPKVFDVYKLNTKTLKTKMILKNPGDYEGFYADQAGTLRAVQRAVGTETEILYRSSNQSPFKVLLKFDYTRNFQPLYFPKGKKTFLAVSNLGRDKMSLVEFNPLTGREERILYQHNEYDFDGGAYGAPIIYSEKQNKILALNILTWKLEQIFFDTTMEKIYQNIQQLSGIKKANIIFVSSDLSENLFTFLISSDRVRGQYYLYNKIQNKLEFLDSAAPWLKEGSLAEMRPIQFMSRDGLVIHGYLTLPKAYKGKPISAVVNPHGGPWHRDVWRYNSEVQFLANRGYAVLQLNFRGSTGYGRDFLKASFKQWGLKMQDDITDGTNWLIQQGYADPKNICIYGGSYGGYATLMGLVKEPHLYACGVDYVGVSNLFTFLKTIPPYWETFMEKMYVMLGHPEKDKEQFTATSPALNVDKIRSPLFIAQGAKDPRVNKDESDQVVKNLKQRGIDVPYMVKENEGHGFRNEENRIEFYSEMEKFLKKHLK